MLEMIFLGVFFKMLILHIFIGNVLNWMSVFHTRKHNDRIKIIMKMDENIQIDIKFTMRRWLQNNKLNFHRQFTEIFQLIILISVTWWHEFIWLFIQQNVFTSWYVFFGGAVCFGVCMPFFVKLRKLLKIIWAEIGFWSLCWVIVGYI